jgi:hypothetical protein
MAQRVSSAGIQAKPQSGRLHAANAVARSRASSRTWRPSTGKPGKKRPSIDICACGVPLLWELLCRPQTFSRPCEFEIAQLVLAGDAFRIHFAHGLQADCHPPPNINTQTSRRRGGDVRTFSQFLLLSARYATAAKADITRSGDRRCGVAPVRGSALGSKCWPLGTRTSLR